jgi:coenzyme F420-reducing hydrogenase beta subunit/polysaccharide pyruvyl transferase WcaK-like protein
MIEQRIMFQVGSISSIPQSHLCISCGSCVGICPKGCISLEINHSGTLLEPKVNELQCIHCGLCTSVCPGAGWDAEGLTPNTHIGEPVNYLGQVVSCYIGCSLDERIRMNSASGGIVTELLIYLLENGCVDGVIVSRMKKGSPLETETFIARTKAEIISSQKSIYCPVPAGKILSDILTENGKFAFVGLPCHIAGLKKAQRINKLLAERIVITIGLFCSRTPNYKATENLLKNVDANKDQVHTLEYRGRGHPGKLRIVLRDGSEIFVDHLDNRYWGYAFLYFFKPIRCWLCHDHSTMLADVSCGDNWIGKDPFKHDQKGSSILVVRTQFVESILSQMRETQKILLKRVSAQEIVDSQNLKKKSSLMPRAYLMRLLKKKVPTNSPLVDDQVNIMNFLASLFEYITIHISNSGTNNSVMNCYIHFSYMIYKLKHNSILKKGSRLVDIMKGGINALKTEKLDIQECEKYRNKIIIIGGFGWKDIGDEAMPHGVIHNLRKRLKNLDIVMLSPDPEFTELFHKERSIQDANFLSIGRNLNLFGKLKVFCATSLFIFGAYMQKHNVRLKLWPNARRILDEISSTTLLFNNGGGNLNSIMPEELYKKCSLYWAAKILKKPVIISGQTIGPFYHWFDKIYAKFCLNQVDFISFRDKSTSYNRLQDIGVTKPIMIDAADDAMTIPKVSRKKAIELLMSEAPDEWLESDAQNCVVMNLKGSMSLFQVSNQKMQDDSIIKVMAQISDALIEKLNSKIFYLPTDYSEGVDDRVLHQQICSQMKHKEKVFCIDNEYDDSALKGLVSLADYAIGSRYHFCVFAASENIPFLGIAHGIYQKTKLKGLADLCGTPQCYFSEDISLENYEAIWSAVVQLIEDSGTIKETFSHTVPILKEKSLLGVKKAEDIVHERQEYSNAK